MQRAHGIIILTLALAVLVIFDLIRTLRTGQAHGKFGIIYRKQSSRFQRYLSSNWIVLALCIATVLWVLIWPETFQR
jgi:hypothetical protein